MAEIPHGSRTMMAAGSVDSRPGTAWSSLPDLLEYQAKRIPDAPALLAPERAPLSYRRLFQHVDQTAQQLRALGIGRQGRVVLVLPNGPEMASAILAVVASAVCAPMNPTYGVEEFARYMADLRPCALLTAAGSETPARRAAIARGLPIIELSPLAGAAAGLF